MVIEAGHYHSNGWEIEAGHATTQQTGFERIDFTHEFEGAVPVVFSQIAT